ncbi:MAG: hypothetical protein B6U76_07165 [Desulfurococcales archaeon ex4484_217_2]|nr:MAG: hypothetical protein B6U76_07165 [Desulfurococcales archaeon ex4484_217_2]
MINRNETYCLKELVKSEKILRKTIESLASGEKVFLLADVLNEGALGLTFMLKARSFTCLKLFSKRLLNYLVF